MVRNWQGLPANIIPSAFSTNQGRLQFTFLPSSVGSTTAVGINLITQCKLGLLAPSNRLQDRTETNLRSFGISDNLFQPQSVRWLRLRMRLRKLESVIWLGVAGRQFYPVDQSVLAPQNGGHVETHALFLAPKANPLAPWQAGTTASSGTKRRVQWS